MTAMREIELGPLRLGARQPLFLIAGPCVIESEEHATRLAEQLTALTSALRLPFVYKASFDKANRSALSSYRGPGLREGLRILGAIKARFGIPLLTDVHEVAQVAPAAEVCDILQVPAFLCRQTDLLLAVGASGRVVNVKKGQFLAPSDMGLIVEKVRSTGNDRILLTERGTTFGYQNLVVDLRAIPILRRLGCPVVLDVTHAVQLPGGAGSRSGGQPEFIETLARAGAAAGIDGLFCEVHEDPPRALSDGANALRMDRLPELLGRVMRLSALAREWDEPKCQTPRSFV